MQQSRHHCVTLYLEEEYEQLALEAYFDIQHVDVLIANRSSFECKFCGNLFKEKNILFYHIMMNLCLDYIGGELLKMYSGMIKVELKELNKLGENFGKISQIKVNEQLMMWWNRPQKELHHQNYRSSHLVCHLQDPYVQRRERYMN
jgi:hypothetical protein